ncbi:RNA dependent RNA polymerase-domain-containing protein [Mycena amicta]|nr:RNA dependent RNA polymerase-domain-containing protein [Mycena amicta]
MEFNFNEYLDDLAPPVLPPERGERSRRPPIFKIRPWSFSMGSTQANVFKEGFRADDLPECFLNLNDSDSGDQSIFFRVRFAEDENEEDPLPILQAVCNIDDVESVHIDKTNDRGRIQGRLTFTLRRPPLLDVDQRRHPSRPACLRRATELDWSPDGAQEMEGGIGAGPPSTMPRSDGYGVRVPMKFGLWLTYSFEFNCKRRDEWDRVVTALSRLRTLRRPGMEEISVVNPEQNPALRGVVIVPRNPRCLFVGEPEDFFDVEGFLASPAVDYPFEARYLVLGLVSQGLILPTEVGHLIHCLWPLIRVSTRTAALRGLFRLPRRLLDGNDAIKKQVRGVSRGRPLRVPKDRIAIRRAVVTPTRVLLFPEVIEMGNRVVRAWPKEMAEGRFIRVGFADEDGRLRATKKVVDGDFFDPEAGILARLRNVLKNGVYIAGRHFVFLAAGESQLKDHSCWMVCEHEEFTADRVREQMGDFSGEKVVAKYAARMGLCLSATAPVAELKVKDIEEIEDIQHGDYTYTDGVGNCSQSLAVRCAVALGSDRKEPSAVQIRMGGIKGVLSVHPHLENNEVCIRRSMQKFVSPLRGLGAMKVSGFAPAHLNRQAICIMEALGVDITKLMDTYKRQIDRAERIEVDFAMLDTGRHPARHIYKNAFLPVLKMVQAGLGKETLLQNVLRCIKCQLLRELKYKARVLVNGGAYLLGIADEYNVLEEGQIYCAVTPKGNNTPQVITGQCTIFRSPCVHPGDARRVTAVNHAAFEKYPLTNVIVFSTKPAKRDLPSMLGGGDLDGDFFTVIYDPDLQITREYPAMDYTAAKPIPQANVTISDVQDFVVEYIKNDVLGIVSSFHQAVADYRGPMSDQCIELAKRASDAVDFAKSGVPVRIEERCVCAFLWVAVLTSTIASSRSATPTSWTRRPRRATRARACWA